VIFVPTFFVVVLGLFKSKPRLLGAEARAFEEEQAAKRAREATPPTPATEGEGE
jgi:multidrug efflux pump